MEEVRPVYTHFHSNGRWSKTSDLRGKPCLADCLSVTFFYSLVHHLICIHSVCVCVCVMGARVWV